MHHERKRGAFSVFVVHFRKTVVHFGEGVVHFEDRGANPRIVCSTNSPPLGSGSGRLEKKISDPDEFVQEERPV